MTPDSAQLASIHPCTAWQSTLRTVTDALQAFLAGRGAVSVATAQPLAAATEAVTLRSSENFICGPAASKLHAILPAARDKLAATAVRSVATRLSLAVAGDGIFELPQGCSAAAQATASIFRLQTPGLPAAATRLRALSTHNQTAPLRYAAGSFGLLTGAQYSSVRLTTSRFFCVALPSLLTRRHLRVNSCHPAATTTATRPSYRPSP